MQMVFDAVGSSIQPNLGSAEEEPNLDASNFFDLLSTADKELWPGCDNMTQLRSVALILNIKSEGHIFDRSLNEILSWYNDSLPTDNNMVDSFYEMKNLLGSLGLAVEKIDCCRLGCMIFWGDDVELMSCKFCNHSRFKPSNVGIKVNCAYNLVEINQRRRLANFEPFVLAMQATQVYYLPFPSLR